MVSIRALSSILRSVGAIFAVGVGISTTMLMGDSGGAKLLAVAVSSGAVALFECLWIWLPKRSSAARRWLDPRARFVGSWMQEVIRSHGRSTEQNSNRFAVFTVMYSKEADNYRVDGGAYTEEGVEHARWHSTDVVHFSRDGKSMTYEWQGPVTNKEVSTESIDRSGFARLNLTSDAGDGGMARVDHVGMDVSLEINFDRITPSWLEANQLSEFKPEQMQTPSGRNRFASAFAKVRALRRA